MFRYLFLLTFLAACGDPEGPAKDEAGDDDDGNTDNIGDDDDDDNTAGDSSDEGGDNDSFATAEPITVEPGVDVEADGKIESPGDRDFYVFDAVAGHTYQLFAEAGGAGDPDTVIEVYGPDEVLIGGSDDLPYRIVGTDSGYWLRAAVDGPHYVQIYDFSDWAGYPPVGNPTFDYTLHVLDLPVWPELNENLNADNDTPEQAFANTTDLDEDGSPESSWFGNSWDPTQPFLESPGAIDPAGDEDWLWFTMDAGELSYCQFSEFPGLVTEANLVYELWREDCNPACDGVGAVRVAATETPGFGTDYGFLEDAGITYPMAGPANYYLHILDADGSGGPDHWYSVLNVCYVGTLAATEVETGEINISNGQVLAETVSTSNPDFSYARFTGTLDGTPIGSPDVVDAYLIDWADAGDTIEVIVETTIQGSLLDDAEVTVWHEDSPGNWVQIGTNSGPTPSVVGLTAADANRIAVTITSAGRGQGLDQYYLGLIAVYQ